MKGDIILNIIYFIFGCFMFAACVTGLIYDAQYKPTPIKHKVIYQDNTSELVYITLDCNDDNDCHTYNIKLLKDGGCVYTTKGNVCGVKKIIRIQY